MILLDAANIDPVFSDRETDDGAARFDYGDDQVGHVKSSVVGHQTADVAVEQVDTGIDEVPQDRLFLYAGDLNAVVSTTPNGTSMSYCRTPTVSDA